MGNAPSGSKRRGSTEEELSINRDILSLGQAQHTGNHSAKKKLIVQPTQVTPRFASSHSKITPNTDVNLEFIRTSMKLMRYRKYSPKPMFPISKPNSVKLNFWNRIHRCASTEWTPRTKRFPQFSNGKAAAKTSFSAAASIYGRRKSPW